MLGLSCARALTGRYLALHLDMELFLDEPPKVGLQQHQGSDKQVRREPANRLTLHETLPHPWFQAASIRLCVRSA